jgi:exodeoxyribonuclease V gamma subunit
VLHVHRAERADGLVEALGALLAGPAEDPFAREVVSVPTRGIERWLTQRLADRLGVCANVEFPPPRRLIADAIAAASGIEPDEDPWLPERLTWPLLELLPGDERHRFETARHVAGLFDRYARHRPELVRDWAGIPADAAWQADLYAELQRGIATPDPAARLARATARLRDEPGLVDLPPRIALFGLTRLPAADLEVLRALAHRRDVHLFVLHPSPKLWEKVASLPGPPPTRRAIDPTAALPANRLLASWGHDVRELQLVLAGDKEEVVEHHHPTHTTGDSLLHRLQAAVREDRPPDIRAIDGSIQVHSCHGRARQVEVLRDAILHALQEDPTLEPRDVIVMCPDIETFAPLIQATFGAGEALETDPDDADPTPPELRPPDLRVRLADRSLRQTNPVLAVVARLLELGDERLTASQVLDLADRDAVRRRFGFDDDDVGRLEEWVRAAGIRWGLDAEHRAPFKVGLAAGTWRAGLDRLLLGVTMTEDEQRLFGDVLPLDDVESGAIDLAGRFAELIDRVAAALDAFAEPMPIAGWARAIADAADALTAATPRDAWQRGELQRLLDGVVDEAGGSETPLALADVRALLADRLKGRPTRANFRTGHLTICTLVPMRSVPHRVVCLLGLDDGVFPRKAPRDGDDLMLLDPHVGERDPRTEDRQQLLDALMAATDRLIVTYTGNDERTNLPRPPAVPVGELLDAVGPGVVVRHPLQPFDERNFAPGELVPGRVWSFDRVTLKGAQALGGERRTPGPFLDGPLPPIDLALLELDDLVAFVRHPVRAFLRRRLELSVREFSDELEDALPVELDGLGRYGVGQRLLEARLAGVGSRAAALAEIARGTLPPGVLGRPVINTVLPIVDAIVDALPPGEPDSVDVRVALPGGGTLRGTVPGVCGDVLRTVTFSRVGPRHRIAAWVQLLALAAAHPGRSFSALTVGRDSGDGIAVVEIPEVEAGDARAHLGVLVDLYARGMREPPPLACRTSEAYARAGGSGLDPIATAQREWESDFKIDHEDREPEHRLVHGGVIAFADLLEPPARADERGPWWDPDETRRFGRWSRRLWDGLLGVERRR